MSATPVWERITPDGKPFGYQSPKEEELNKKIKELEEEMAILKKENEQLRELFEEEKPKK